MIKCNNLKLIKMAEIRPVGDRILVKQHKAEETYGSTVIYIPES